MQTLFSQARLRVGLLCSDKSLVGQSDLQEPANTLGLWQVWIFSHGHQLEMHVCFRRQRQVATKLPNRGLALVDTHLLRVHVSHLFKTTYRGQLVQKGEQVLTLLRQCRGLILRRSVIQVSKGLRPVLDALVSRPSSTRDGVVQSAKSTPLPTVGPHPFSFTATAVPAWMPSATAWPETSCKQHANVLRTNCSR